MAKGNDGSAARRRTLRKLLIAVGIALVVTFGIVFYQGSESSAGNSYRFNHGRQDDDFRARVNNRFKRHDRVNRRAKARGFGGLDRNGFADAHRRNGGGHETGKRNKGQYQTDDVSLDAADDDVLATQYRKDLIFDHKKPQRAEAFLEGILNGSINLSDIDPSYKLRPSADGSYHGVYGHFCKLNWPIYKKDPSSYPMFRFLVQASPDCNNGNSMLFDLKKVAYLARRRDQEVETIFGEGPKLLNITAVAFHETRCGSTLVANSMVAMDPEKHRSYSESRPPSKAFHICGEDYERCTTKQNAAILRDTIYMMSRTDDHREERVFFKFQSSTCPGIPVFQMAFPDVPWMFVYREPVQVIMSHAKDDITMKRTVCTKTRAYPSRELHDIARRHGRNSPQELDGVEFCAAHLAELTEAVVNNLNDMAIPVAYDQLPDMMWETIFPKILDRPMKQFEIDNLKAISNTYSKGGARTNKKGEYKDDSKEKEKKASDNVRQAAKEFLQESFDQLAAFEPKLLR